MASVIFKRLPDAGIQKRHALEFSRPGKGLRKFPQTPAQEQLKPRPGERGYFPAGVDKRRG